MGAVSAQNANAYSFKQFEHLHDASRTPADLLSVAWAQAIEIREQARIEGEAAGYAAGLERAQAEFKELAQTLANGLGEAAGELAATRDELVESLTREAGEISLRVAGQIVAGAFEFQPDLVIDVTRAAIRRLAERHRLTVLLNPADMERVGAAIDGLRAETGGIEYLEVQADRRVEPGTVIVETEYGEIDATIATQIQNARAIVCAGLVGDSSLHVDEAGHADAV
jgi:flagellar assembly protein FliH